MSAVRALIAYALYTVDARTVAVQRTEKLVLTVPFVLYGLYRLLWVFYRGGGGPTLQPNCCTTPSFCARRSGGSAASGAHRISADARGSAFVRRFRHNSPLSNRAL